MTSPPPSRPSALAATAEEPACHEYQPGHHAKGQERLYPVADRRRLVVPDATVIEASGSLLADDAFAEVGRICGRIFGWQCCGSWVC